MDIQIMRKDRSTESGASLLRLMQSKSIKNLDLLVRESLQNSLDASKERKSKTVVKVDFKTGSYKTKEFTTILGDVGVRLDHRYPNSESNFIAIRDSNTVGLTGTNDPNDDRCNLQKLIYQISKPQEKKGSGGNWGLGKTTFFRLGIGIVLYYSRIVQNGKYECRLAASLVENEEDNPLVTDNGYRGIAYFGKREAWPNAPSDYTVPLTDEEEIARIIKIFGLIPYVNEETGTTVVIPYVDFDALLSEMIPTDFSKSGRKPVWLSDIDNCLKLLIQRWYAPRLSNSEYDGSWLKASVNGVTITHERMEPFFRVMQDLYNKAYSSARKSEDLPENDFVIQPINIKDVVGKKCGVLSLVIIDATRLNLTKEKYRNIYALIGDYDVPVGNPIIAYVRKPAMISRYETINSAWVPSLQNYDENKIVIGLFVLDSSKDITIGKDVHSLEEYVRDGERSDHYGWHDDSINTFVKRISDNVKNKISANINQKSTSNFEKRSKLSDVFTEMFLPPDIEYINKAAVGETGIRNVAPSQKTGKSKGIKSKNVIITNDLTEGNRIIVFQTKLGNNDENVDYKFIISSENGSISPNEWEEAMKTKYPLHLISFSITGYARPKGNIVPCQFNADLSKNTTCCGDFIIDTDRSISHVPYGANVTCKSGSTIECTAIIGSDIPSVSFDIRCTTRRCKE